MATYSASASIPAVDKDVPLSLFGGANTELSPTDLPEGGSPDSEDVEFYPGSVQTRRGLHSVLDTPLPASPVYIKTYNQPNNVPITLMLDIQGNLWQELPLTSPGTYTLLRACIPGVYGQSVTAFGREYIALSDTQRGADIPLQFDGTHLDRVTQDGPGAPPAASDELQTTLNIVSVAPSTGSINIVSAIENGTLITVTTALAHGMFVNDQVLVQTGNATIDNNSEPITVQEVPSPTSFSYEVGLPDLPAYSSGTIQPLTCLVTVSAPHGLLTGDSFLIFGTNSPYDNNYNNVINGNATALTQIEEVGTTTVATVVTATPHGLQPGALITVDTGNASYDQSGTLFPVLTVDSPTVLTYDTGVSGLPTLTSGGAFTVTQRINVNSPPSWNVRTVQSPTEVSFSGVAVAGTITMGTFKGGGLSSEGAHQCVVMFQTRQGAITAPSPPVTFTSGGNRKFTISNIPIGPPNVVARILAFTGSGGDNFFYIPTTPMGTDVTGDRVPIGTSTVINDNTTSSIVMDIADDTLFAALGIDIPGNNLFAQVVLGPCLGFASYSQRLIAWGEYNKIQNFLNMGFAGGYLSTTQPLGWTVLNPGGILVDSDVGMAWKISGSSGGPSGSIYQGAYQDWTGAQIVLPNTQYTFRFRAFGSNTLDPGVVRAHIFSASTGFSTLAAYNLFDVGTTPEFYQVNFDALLPAVIPPDLKIAIETVAQTTGHFTQIDEMEIVPTVSPYRNNVCRGSYVINPEGFDGVTGNFGPSDDPSPMQCLTTIRNNLILHTAETTSSTSDNGQEPSGWVINSISKAVGALSFRSCDPNKTGTGDAGEEWEVVASQQGLYLFAGEVFYKISEEYQSEWNQIDWNSRGQLWVKNDTGKRLIMVGIPFVVGTLQHQILVMSYLNLDTGTQIGNAPAIRIGFTGRMIATDVSRKWTTWNVPAQCGQVLYRPSPVMYVGAGNGIVGGQIFWFDPAKKTDDVYGQIFSYWVSYFFVNHDQEVQLGVGSHMKLFAYLSAFVQGIGQIMFIPFANNLNNPWPATPLYPLSASAVQDLEWPLNVTTERCAFKIAPVPLPGQTDAFFNLQKLVVTLRMNALFPVRGAL